MSEQMKKSLAKDFRDREYRQIYWGEFLNTLIATQIKVLRESRGLSQAQLAAMIGTTQPAVSAHESPDKKSWSISTLRKIADALDVFLIVKFEGARRALDEISSFRRETLTVPAVDEDPLFKDESVGTAASAMFLSSQPEVKLTVVSQPDQVLVTTTGVFLLDGQTPRPATPLPPLETVSRYQLADSALR